MSKFTLVHLRDAPRSSRSSHPLISVTKKTERSSAHKVRQRGTYISHIQLLGPTTTQPCGLQYLHPTTAALLTFRTEVNIPESTQHLRSASLVPYLQH
jgi:hypothetical protein